MCTKESKLNKGVYRGLYRGVIQGRLRGILGVIAIALNLKPYRVGAVQGILGVFIMAHITLYP